MSKATTSKNDICNLALSYIKTDYDAVLSIDTPKSVEEFACARWYDDVRESTLSLTKWLFSTKRVLLPELSESPVFGGGTAYELPNDFIRLSTIGDVNSSNFEYVRGRDYRIEGKQLILSQFAFPRIEGALPLRYIYNNEDVTTFSPLFIQLFAVSLALKLCYQFTGDNTSRQWLKEEYEDLERKAKSINAQDNVPISYLNSPMVTIRRRVGTSTLAQVGFLDFNLGP